MSKKEKANYYARKKLGVNNFGKKTLPTLVVEGGLTPLFARKLPILFVRLGTKLPR